MTNSECVVRTFEGLQCQCEVPHFHVQGNFNGVQVSKHCQIYTLGLCQKLAVAVFKEAQRLEVI